MADNDQIFVIGFGGSGARALTSVVHLCAAGMGPPALTLIVVDADTANYGVTLLENTLKQYQRCREALGFRTTGEIFGTAIDSVRGVDGQLKVCWSPAAHGENLRGALDLAHLRVTAPAVHDLLGALYTAAELDLEWDYGFCGHPSIGAAAMPRIEAQMANGTPPWGAVEQRCKEALQNGNVKAFVVGSVFGATGASGVPALARSLRARSKEWTNRARLRIGGCCVLPYFAYDVPPDQIASHELYARPENFLLNAKSALGYYGLEYARVTPWNALYFAGEAVGQTRPDFARGGQAQRNPFHFIDLLGALACLHFLTSNSADSDQPLDERGSIPGIRIDQARIHACARRDEKSIRWADLPKVADVDLRSEFLDFLTMGLAVDGFFAPLVADERFDADRHLSAWYQRDGFYEAEDHQLGRQKQRAHLEVFREFFDLTRRWFVELLENETVSVQLVNAETHKKLLEMVHAGKGELVLMTGSELLNVVREVGEPRASGNGYGLIWRRLCSSRPNGHGTASGRFLLALHSACAEANALVTRKSARRTS